MTLLTFSDRLQNLLYRCARRVFKQADTKAFLERGFEATHGYARRPLHLQTSRDIFKKNHPEFAKSMDNALMASHRTVESIVRRLLVCQPKTNDPAECGLGRGPAIRYVFQTCRAYFVVGLEDVRTIYDDPTLPKIIETVRRFLASERVTDIKLEPSVAYLMDDNRNIVRTISYADVRMPNLPPRGERQILDRTMGRGWRRRMWTIALLYRAVLWRHRGLEQALKDSKTALVLIAFENLPRDVLRQIVTLVRTP